MPTPAPMIVASLIGVSITRSAPKRCCRPLYWPKMPPRPTSSPSTTHVRRRLPSRAAPRARRLRRSSCSGGAAVRVHVVHCPAPVVCTSVKAAAGVGPGRGVGGRQRGVDLVLALRRRSRRALRAGAARRRHVARARAIGSVSQRGCQLGRVAVGGRVDRDVALHAVGDRVQQPRPGAAAHLRRPAAPAAACTANTSLPSTCVRGDVERLRRAPRRRRRPSSGRWRWSRSSGCPRRRRAPAARTPAPSSAIRGRGRG